MPQIDVGNGGGLLDEPAAVAGPASTSVAPIESTTTGAATATMTRPEYLFLHVGTGLLRASGLVRLGLCRRLCQRLC